MVVAARSVLSMAMQLYSLTSSGTTLGLLTPAASATKTAALCGLGCDSDVTKSSYSCDDTAAAWTEYCSPHSIMGYGGLDKPFYMDGKLTFDWADSVNHPDLISNVDWDSVTNKYTDCDPSCDFLLQRSDAATLDDSVSAVILLQTTHSSSNGNRYFVMERRNDTLLVHWTDINPNGGRTGRYGNTVLTGCNPETNTWDDAGCSLGQHIELDAGDEMASVRCGCTFTRRSITGS